MQEYYSMDTVGDGWARDEGWGGIRIGDGWGQGGGVGEGSQEHYADFKETIEGTSRSIAVLWPVVAGRRGPTVYVDKGIISL